MLKYATIYSRETFLKTSMSVFYGPNPFKTLGGAFESAPDRTDAEQSEEQRRYNIFQQARNEAFRGNDVFQKFMDAFEIFKDYKEAAPPGTVFSDSWPSNAEEASDVTEKLFGGDLFQFLKMKQTNQDFRNRFRHAIKTLLNKCIPPRVYVRNVIPVEVQLALLMKFSPDVRNILLLGDECSTDAKITCLGNAMQYAPAIETVYISLFTTTPRPTWTLVQGMDALSRWAKQAPAIQRLNIDGPIIGDAGVALLAEALKSRSTFHSLYLNNVGCSVVGAKAVTSLIDHKRNMRQISLDNNAIGDEGVRDIVDSLSIADSGGGTAVRLLSLRGVEMTYDTCVYVIRKGMDWSRYDPNNPTKTVTLRLTRPANVSETQSREIQNAIRDASARKYLTLEFR